MSFVSFVLAVIFFIKVKGELTNCSDNEAVFCTRKNRTFSSSCAAYLLFVCA